MPFDPSVLNEIEANLDSLQIDDIKKRLELLKSGYAIQSPVFDPGAFVYRGRLISPTFNKATGIARKDLIYPPANVASLGRLNRAGQSIFYCSMHKESVFFELRDLQPGNELILTFWKTTDRMFVNNIGYTEFSFKELGAKRLVPRWGPFAEQPDSTKATVALSEIPEDVRNTLVSEDQNRELKEGFSRYFMRKIADDESRLYRLTVAIGEIHLGTIVGQENQFAGILYPSVRMWANGDNLALLPWFVDNHLEFRKAVHVQIKGRTGTTIDIDYVDAAHEFDEAGELKWLGRVQSWTLQPKQGGKFVGVAGPDQDGDYTTAGNGQPAHWTAQDMDTGKPIYPA
jgi:RES domain